MDALTKETFLDQLIYIQRRAIRSYILFGIGLVVLGVIVMAVGIFSPVTWFTPYFPNAQDGVKGAIGLGGGFIASLISMPVKEIVERRGKITIFETYRDQFKNLKNTSKAEKEKIQKRLEELMWSYFEKATLS